MSEIAIDAGRSEKRVGIDPKFVNSSELSDVVFRVEARPFYAHRIVLVNASPVFKQLLHAADNNNSIHIDNISYHVFQVGLSF